MPSCFEIQLSFALPSPVRLLPQADVMPCLNYTSIPTIFTRRSRAVYFHETGGVPEPPTVAATSSPAPAEHTWTRVVLNGPSLRVDTAAAADTRVTGQAQCICWKCCQEEPTSAPSRLHPKLNARCQAKGAQAPESKTASRAVLKNIACAPTPSE